MYQPTTTDPPVPSGAMPVASSSFVPPHLVAQLKGGPEAPGGEGGGGDGGGKGGEGSEGGGAIVANPPTQSS